MTERKTLFEIKPPLDSELHQCDWDIDCTECDGYYVYCTRNAAEPGLALAWMAAHARSHGVGVSEPSSPVDHNLFLVKQPDDPLVPWEISCLKCDFNYRPRHGPETRETQDMLRRHTKECKGGQHGEKSKTENS